MPHKIEPAKSSRSACRGCGSKIQKAELRLGEEYSGDYGMAFRWYHLMCGAKKLPSVLEDALARFEDDVPDLGALQEAMANAADAPEQNLPKYPEISIAPTGRASCVLCDEKISKGDTRIAIEREIDTGSFVTKGAGYLHPECVGGWLSEQDDVDPEAFNRVLTAKGGTAAKVEKKPEVAVPTFEGMTSAQIKKAAKGLMKVVDPNGHELDEYLEALDWGQRDTFLWFLAKNGLVQAGKNAGLWQRLANSLDRGDPATVIGLLGGVPVSLRRLFGDYGVDAFLPNWTHTLHRLAMYVLQNDEPALSKRSGSFGPNVRTGIAFARMLLELPISPEDKTAVASGLTCQAGNYPLEVETPDGDLVTLSRVELGHRLDHEAWLAALQTHLKKNIDELNTTFELGEALVLAKPKTFCETLLWKSPEWAEVRGWIDERGDAQKLVKAAVKLDKVSGRERLLLTLFGALESIPKDAETHITFELITAPEWRSAYDDFLGKLGSERALALADQELEQGYGRCLPSIVAKFDPETARIEAYLGLEKRTHYGPEIAALGARVFPFLAEQAAADKIGVPAMALRAIARATADKGDEVPAFFDGQLIVGPYLTDMTPTFEALPAARRTTLILAAMAEHKRPEVPLHLVVLLEPEDRLAAMKILVKRRKKIKKRYEFEAAIRLLGEDGPDLFEAVVAESDGDRAFLGRLEKAFSKETYEKLAAAAEVAVETPTQKLLALTEGKENKRDVLLLDGAKKFPDLAVETASFSGGTPSWIKAPEGTNKVKTHILTIDLRPFPALQKKMGGEAMSLFIESPNTAKYHEQAQLVVSDVMGAAPENSRPISVAVASLPLGALEGRGAVAADLRRLLGGLAGHAFGDGIWVQRTRDELGPILVQVNDAYGLNLGDSGSLYVGEYGAGWDCY